MSEIAKLFVTIDANLEGFNKGLGNVQNSLGNAQQTLGKFGANATKYVTLPVLGAAAAVGGLVIKTGNWADELLDLSAATGIHTDTLQRYRHMSARAGTETDAVADSVLMLTRQMTDLNTFSKRVEDTAADYNVQLRDMDGNARAAEDVHWDLMMAIASIQDPQERAIAGAQAFGRQWEALAPIIDLGAEALEGAAEIEVIDRDKLEKANEFRELWDDIKHSFEILAYEAGIQLIEMLNEVFDLSPENLKDKIMEVRDALQRVIEKIQEKIEWWQNLSPEMQNFYQKVGLLVLFLGPTAQGLAGVLGLVSGALSLLASAKLGSFASAATAGSTAASGGLAIFMTKVLAATYVVWGLIEAIKGLVDWFRRVKDEGLSEVMGQSAARGLEREAAGMGRGGATNWQIPSYDTGGIVPGPRGAPRLAVVHGGETILPTHRDDSDGGRIVNNIHVDRMQVRDEKDIDEIARELYRLQTRRDRGVN